MRYTYEWVCVISDRVTFGIDSALITWQFQLTFHGGAALLANVFPPTPLQIAVSVVGFTAGTILEQTDDLQLASFVKRKAAGATAGKKVLTTGLRAVVRHPNWLGNVIWWVSGVCVLSGTWLFPLAFVPVMFVFYTFQAGPALEGHMHRKYGAEWDEYAARVPMLVPFATCGLEKSASLV